MKNILLISLAFVLLSAKEPKLITQKMVDGITVGMPKDFTQMSDDDIANKYPSTKKPVSMYTNLDRTVDFGLNISKSRWGGLDLTILKDIFHSTIVESYDTVIFLQEDIISINGRPYVRYEYNSLFDNTQGTVDHILGLRRHRRSLFSSCVENNSSKNIFLVFKINVSFAKISISSILSKVGLS